MENTNRYIGIPWVFNEDSFEAADCTGLVQLFYQEHGWKPNTYPKPTARDWYLVDKLGMQKFLVKNFDKTRDAEDLQFGDVVYMMINGEGHCGIYLEYGKVLSTFPPGVKLWDGSMMPDRSFILRESMWKPVFKAGFKRKE